MEWVSSLFFTDYGQRSRTSFFHNISGPEEAFSGKGRLKLKVGGPKISDSCDKWEPGFKFAELPAHEEFSNP